MLWGKLSLCSNITFFLRFHCLSEQIIKPGLWSSVHLLLLVATCWEIHSQGLLKLYVMQSNHQTECMNMDNASVQFSSVAQSCPTLCDPMNCSTPGLPVHHQLPEFAKTHVHWVGDAIQPSHPLSSPSPPAPNPSQHQDLFQWVNSSHEVAKVLEFQL